MSGDSARRSGQASLRVARITMGEHELAILSVPLRATVELTHAEREIVGRVAAGESDRQIASARGTSPRTVANQLRTLFRRLGVSSRAELLSRIFAAGRPTD
jgi:DNA-binding CsgD family transcriptional regulator